ncbi:MAG: DUF3179 domain-containing protein [Tabrizicola sp.]|jgi:hypothetical protein|nr:DUF3179 domain-containing protein [Tabrizicola sp.]
MPRRLFLACLLSALLAGPLAADPAEWADEWPRTDFSRHNVDLTEILSGGPPKDGIPAVDDPTFLPAREDTLIDDREPVLTLELGDDVRAYPIRYLMWHEIANDTVGGVPVAVTFCPLCNTAMVFDRRVADQVLDFGVSGKLRASDMVMYDRQTESWWQQALGQGIVGEMTGMQLTQLPAVMESWAQFRARHPDGLVMAQPAFPRQYGVNPYAGYDSLDRPFLYDGEDPPHGISPLARVVRVGTRAWPLERLRKAGLVKEAGVILTWEEGQASALDSGDIAQGQEVGTVRVTDAQGRAVVHDMPFAFAFHAFHPTGEWMLGN